MGTLQDFQKRRRTLMDTIGATSDLDPSTVQGLVEPVLTNAEATLTQLSNQYKTLNAEKVSLEKKLAALQIASETTQRTSSATIDQLKADKLSLEQRLAASTARIINVKSATDLQSVLDNTIGDPHEKAKALSDAVRRAYVSDMAKGIILYDPTLDEEMNFWRSKDVPCPTPAAEGLKSLHSVPVFTGDNQGPTWVQFEHPWLIAIRNRNLSEQTLRTALASKLQGPAGMFYIAIPMVETKGFADVMDILRERYTLDTTAASHLVDTTTQNASESVESYAAKMLVAARGLMPRPPKELQVIRFPEGQTFVFPNPLVTEQNEQYKSGMDQVHVQLCNPFLRGLKPEIRARLHSKRYVRFDVAKQAAVEAEWMLTFEGVTVPVYNVQTDNADEEVVHALTRGGKNTRGTFRGRGRGGSFRGSRGRGRGGGSFYPPRGAGNAKPNSDRTRGECFTCHKKGHFTRDCPMNLERSNNALTGQFRVTLSQQEMKQLQKLANAEKNKGNSGNWKKQFINFIDEVIEQDADSYVFESAEDEIGGNSE